MTRGQDDDIERRVQGGQVAHPAQESRPARTEDPVRIGTDHVAKLAISGHDDRQIMVLAHEPCGGPEERRMVLDLDEAPDDPDRGTLDRQPESLSCGTPVGRRRKQRFELQTDGDHVPAIVSADPEVQQLVAHTRRNGDQGIRPACDPALDLEESSAPGGREVALEDVSVEGMDDRWDPFTDRGEPAERSCFGEVRVDHVWCPGGDRAPQGPHGSEIVDRGHRSPEGVDLRRARADRIDPPFPRPFDPREEPRVIPQRGQSPVEVHGLPGGTADVEARDHPQHTPRRLRAHRPSSVTS